MKPYLALTDYELEVYLNLQLRLIKDKSIKSDIERLIDLAMSDDAWTPTTDFDGCSVVQDYTHPDISCFIHDWLWATNKGGLYSNKLFYKLMLLFGYSKKIAFIRYIAVCLTWELLYKYKRKTVSNISLNKVKQSIKFIV